jgi:RNA polymerase sigma-70 factor (ECF subfamily)
MPEEMSLPSPGPNDGRFATTRWSLVLNAGGRAEAGASSEGGSALAMLCQSYWYPLYAFLRRQGHDSHAAADLTQGFFAHLVAGGGLGAADPERGRFRSFLLASLKNFAANERRRERAEKRGGGNLPVSLDVEEGEQRYSREPADELTPERVFERRWALTVIDRAMARLEEEFAAAGKLAVFTELKGFLSGDDSRPQQEVADRLGMTAGAVKVAVHRLRKRCRELLREEVAGTVATPEEIDDEIQRLMGSLAG